MNALSLKACWKQCDCCKMPGEERDELMPSWKGESVEGPYHPHTLCRRPGSSPQATMLLPEEAMRRHCQDPISTGAGTHKKEKHWGSQRTQWRRRKCTEDVTGNKSLPVCCQSTAQKPGWTLRSQQWPGACWVPRTGSPLPNSTCCRWSRGKTSQCC